MEDKELVDVGSCEAVLLGSASYFLEDILYWYEQCYDRRFYLEKSDVYGTSSPRNGNELRLDKAIAGLTYPIADLRNKNIRLTEEVERLGQELDLMRSELDR